jgi:hypothetical protein
MSFQMRQMLLINAGTNKHEPSNRITSIDPRGGASVLGENGVGKTTTLRIIPLFFGHLPSQIVLSGQGQEPMIRYILPTDASAIAFEYQRGTDNEADLRLAVIRRRGDESDAPEYRLYRSGYRQELFVSEGRFLTDDESQKQASLLGIETTGKLSTTQYRSVILKTGLTAKDKKRMLAYSRDFSFGPKQLDNLDRLVAAMVKKHINFADIVQVAVGLVQYERGLGSDRAQLSIRHGRAPFDRWMSNHAACVDAIKLAPKIAELEDALKEHRALEARFRERRADVRLVHKARASELTVLAAAIEAMTEDREQVVLTQTARRAELGRVSAAAGETASAAKREFEEALADSRYYDTERAAYWDGQVRELPSLRLKKKTIDCQIEVAEAANKEASGRYEQLVHDTELDAGARQLALEVSKTPYQAGCEQTIEVIVLAEQKALHESAAADLERRQQLDDSKEPLFEQRGVWEAQVRSPTTSDETLQAQSSAKDRLLKHTKDTGTARDVVATAVAQHKEAQHVFSGREGDLRQAKAKAEQATDALNLAQKRLNPDAGTFMSALRMHGDESWKATLAKIVNPDLLERDDLDPKAIGDFEDAVQTAYGWQINTGAILSPEWTDDTALRQAIELAASRLDAAQKHQDSAKGALSDSSGKLASAKQAQEVAQARFSVLAGQMKELETAVGVADQRVQAEKKQAKAKAESELNRIRGEIQEIAHQINNLSQAKSVRDKAIRSTHDALRTEAKTLRDDAIRGIDISIQTLKDETFSRVQQIRQQLNDHLSEAGIDVAHLDDLKKLSREVGNRIDDAEAKQSLTRRWHDWLSAGGNTRVETLKSAALAAAEAANTHSTVLNTFIASIETSRTEFEAALKAKQDRAKTVEDDIEILTALDENDFGAYQPLHTSLIDPSESVKELRAKVKVESIELKKLAADIDTRFTALRAALTTKDSAVRELVEVSLLDAATFSEIGRAEILCSCYKLIGPQVVTDVNTTLRTLVANIGAFQREFASFETEVASFNKRLQAGLGEVRRFERIKDLQLHLVTNFEGLGFYKSLSKMQDVVRQQSTEFGKDYSRDLPSDETVRALADFQNKIGNDGNLEVNLASHITLKGSVTDNGVYKEFKRSSELESISSDGLTSLILITLLTALLNTVRKGEPVHVPWVTDEVARLDSKNFVGLMKMLQENHIDVVTASPELGITQLAMFSHHYLFEDRGRIREYDPSIYKPLVAKPKTSPLQEVG